MRRECPAPIDDLEDGEELVERELRELHVLEEEADAQLDVGPEALAAERQPLEQRRALARRPAPALARTRTRTRIRIRAGLEAAATGRGRLALVPVVDQAVVEQHAPHDAAQLLETASTMLRWHALQPRNQQKFQNIVHTRPSIVTHESLNAKYRL